MPSPALPLSTDERTRLFRRGSFTAVVLLVGLATLEGTWNIGTASMLSVALALLLLTRFPTQLGPVARGRISVSLVTVMLFGHVVVNGGTDAAAMRTLPAMPLLAIWVGGRLFGSVIAALFVLGVEAIYLGESLGIVFPVSTRSPLEEALAIQVTVSVGLLTYVLAIFYEHMRDQAHQERERVQRTLRINQRLASMGTFTSGIGHEINNPLTTLSTNLRYVANVLERNGDTDPEERSEVREAIEDSIEGTERIARIVRELRSLAAGPAAQVSVVSAQEIYEGIHHLALSACRHSATLKVEVGDAPEIQTAPALLQQVLLNLITNAAHAIQDGRADENEIVIRTGTVTADNVSLFVEDTGPGISPENLEQIFDPFFTTKEPWQGTGLGLAICNQMMTSIGGSLYAENLKPTGARFVVTVPRATLQKAVIPEKMPDIVSQHRVLVA